MTTEMYDLLYLIDSLITITLKGGLILLMLSYCIRGLTVRVKEKIK